MLPLFYFWYLLVTRRYQYWCCCHKHISNSCLFLSPLINLNVVKQQIIFTHQDSQSWQSWSYVNPNYTVWSCSLVKYFSVKNSLCVNLYFILLFLFFQLCLNFHRTGMPVIKAAIEKIKNYLSPTKTGT